MTKRVFNLPYLYQTVGEMNRSVGSIYACIHHHDNHENVSKMTHDELDNIVYRAEKIALTARKNLEEIEKNELEINEFFDEESSFSYQKNMPVSIDFDGKTLRVFTPLTFKRFYREKSLKENYILMNYVAAALKQWADENNFDLFHCVGAPLMCVIVRKSHRWDRNKIFDNDNLEIGRIMNTIVVENLGYSDNAMNLTMCSSFRIVPESEPEGMEFIIFKKSELGEHIHEI